jgi:ketosteroid isomerase-like protein
MIPCKSSLSRLAWTATLIGVAACAGPQPPPIKPKEPAMKDEQVATVERVIADMEAAFARKDIEAAVAIFAEDATVESYLVTRIFNREDGVCRGRAEIREMIRAVLQRGTPWGGHEPPIVRGNTAAIEYWSASPDNEKFSVDIIEVRDGKVQSLRAYAGWRAITALVGAPRD